MMAPPSNRLLRPAGLLVLAGVVLLAVRGSLGGGFVFDDFYLLALPRYYDNPLLPFWQEHVEGGLHYRPLGLVLWWISERLFGARPLLHYLLNAALLIAVAAGLWRLLEASGARRSHAFVLALAFAVSPVAVATDIWLANRYELLACLFGLAALVACRRYRTGGATSDLVIATVLFALALAAKESALALIAAAVVLIAWPLDGLARWTGLRDRGVLVLVALVAAWFVVRAVVLPAEGVDALLADTSPARLVREGAIAWFRQWWSFFGLWPRLDGFVAAAYLIGMLLFVVLLASGLRSAWSRDRMALLVAGLVVFLASGLVQWPRTGLALGHLQFGRATFEDVLGARHYFMPWLGLAMAFAALLAAPAAPARRVRAIAVVASVCLVAGLFSVSQHLARSQRAVSRGQMALVEAASTAIGQLDLDAGDCQIFVLDSGDLMFRFFLDPAIKAIAPDPQRLARCYIQSESAPWFHLVDTARVERSATPPFSPVRAGAAHLRSIPLGRAALVFVNLVPGAAPPRGVGSHYLALRNGRFEDVGDEVRSGARAVQFECFRAPAQCP